MSYGLFETAHGSHAGTQDWLTPPEILQRLEEFDLDPCASQFQPWRTAKTQYTIDDDGLTKEWRGRVWCNPPYGHLAERWLARCAEHKNATAFIFARTETRSFHRYVWDKACALLFLRGRVQFRLPGGGIAGNAGAPSVLIAYDSSNAERLSGCGIEGKLVYL